MAADGTRGPKPYEQRQASTLFVRVPAVNWPFVKRGHHREFCGLRGKAGSIVGILSIPTPTPIVAYSMKNVGRYGNQEPVYEHALMVLQVVRHEPIAAVDFEAQGHVSFAAFRRSYMERTHERFDSAEKVMTYRVRPWEPGDTEAMGFALLNRLYGDFLP